MKVNKPDDLCRVCRCIPTVLGRGKFNLFSAQSKALMLADRLQTLLQQPVHKASGISICSKTKLPNSPKSEGKLWKFTMVQVCVVAADLPGIWPQARPGTTLQHIHVNIYRRHIICPMYWSPANLRSWTQLNCTGKPAINTWDRLSGLLIFRGVAEPRISTKSAKSREIHQNTRNPAKFARNLTKYMSAQYIWNLSWLLGLLTCCKRASLPRK